ncbi:hypothetical protein [Massilia terrae]|uniref:Uncharacterized protein n=1 Tax=Massilia terrae TaxID=1811224 RepID=A0ABT2CXV7_9BURK|nr:hypothetical protein [Massilia terrae]MCS0658816.1 hypothetical protein [Massilia terrae]
MSKFTYNDIVRIRQDCEPTLQRGRAWVVGVIDEREGDYFNKFPPGVVYTIEFEDGSSTEVHEGSLEFDPSQFEEESPAFESGEGPPGL